MHWPRGGQPRHRECNQKKRSRVLLKVGTSKWVFSASRCHPIRLLLFAVARDILHWCGTSDKCVCRTKAAEQRAGQNLERDNSCGNKTVYFHSVYVWDPQNARNGHVLVLWSPSSGFCHCWCDEQRPISKAEPVLPSQQLGCSPQRATWIWCFVQSPPSAWCHHCQQPCSLLSIDEAMIKFNGRLSFKQYVKGVYWWGGGGGGGINAQVGRCGFCYYCFIAVPTCMWTRLLRAHVFKN